MNIVQSDKGNSLNPLHTSLSGEGELHRVVISRQSPPSQAPQVEGNQSLQTASQTNLESSLAGSMQDVGIRDDHPRLGLRLVGHRDPCLMGVFVADLVPDTPASKDGRIWIGDQILEV